MWAPGWGGSSSFPDRAPTSSAKPKNLTEGQMNSLLPNLLAVLQSLKNGEEGQDLVEYALLVCLIALASIVGVNQVAQAITTVFSNISASLS
jgi:Flp pilus assembly pilin Flp